MKKLILLVSIFVINTYCALAQTIKTTQPFGVVDTADLRMIYCDFEKDAGMMILFDKADITTSLDLLVMERHRRIKVFKNNTSIAANIRLPYYDYHNIEKIVNVEAQTINLDGNKIVITKIEPKLIYVENTDKYSKSIVFAFPAVKAGSVIEYKYKWSTSFESNFPTWCFQSDMPTRYSELNTQLSRHTVYDILIKGNLPFASDTAQNVTQKGKDIEVKNKWAKRNIPSYVVEPFVTPGKPNVDYISHRLHLITDGGYSYKMNGTWIDVAKSLGSDYDFADEFNRSVANEDELIKNASALKTTDEKIAYLFNQVKSSMQWNKVNSLYPAGNIKTAWNKHTGNATEINLILYNLLIKAKIDAWVMVVSTRDNGVLSPYYIDYGQLNKTVAFVPVDSTHYYVLDASNKYNLYNVLPFELVNTYALYIKRKYSDIKYHMTFLKNTVPAEYLVLVNGEITADNKLKGSTEINNLNYSKAAYRQLYAELGPEKYADKLKNNDSQLKITDLTLENMEVDSLPLIQKFNFNAELAFADGKYIYFHPNLFSSLHDNPFLSETRHADIDFVIRNRYSINGNYKLPPGYKLDALPANINLNSPDKSITFKRTIGESNGMLQVHYNLNINREDYSVAEYKAIREFYKKMFDMLNEPVVLKKAN